jgi:membrane-associated two-gene conflict system component 1 (EACC1)
MTQEGSFRLQLTSVDLNESSLQAITRELTKSLNEQNIGEAMLSKTATRSGAKGDPITIGSIVLALLGSGGVAVSLVQVLRAYVERKRTLQFELTRPDGKKLNFTAENLADKDLMQNATKVLEQFIAS